MGNQQSAKLTIEEEYIQAVHVPICMNNAFSEGINFRMFDSEYNGTFSANKLISYTEGLNKPSNYELLTDSNFKGEMKLDVRCKLLRDYNEALYKLIPKTNELEHKYNMELSMDSGTCKIFRHTTYKMPEYMYSELITNESSGQVI